MRFGMRPSQSGLDCPARVSFTLICRNVAVERVTLASMTLKATLTAAFPEARRISNFLERDYGEDGVVVSLDERADGAWSVDAYFQDGGAGEIADESAMGLGRTRSVLR